MAQINLQCECGRVLEATVDQYNLTDINLIVSICDCTQAELDKLKTEWEEEEAELDKLKTEWEEEESHLKNKLRRIEALAGA